MELFLVGDIAKAFFQFLIEDHATLIWRKKKFWASFVTVSVQYQNMVICVSTLISMVRQGYLFEE